jgi:hypothetical protein
VESRDDKWASSLKPLQHEKGFGIWVYIPLAREKKEVGGGGVRWKLVVVHDRVDWNITSRPRHSSILNWPTDDKTLYIRRHSLLLHVREGNHLYIRH